MKSETFVWRVTSNSLTSRKSSMRALSSRLIRYTRVAVRSLTPQRLAADHRTFPVRFQMSRSLGPLEFVGGDLATIDDMKSLFFEPGAYT